MKQLFEIDIFSDYGPQAAYLKVEVDGSTAIITNINQETTEVPYASVDELIRYVRENFEDAFMTAPEFQVAIEADPEIESLVREMLWEYRE